MKSVADSWRIISGAVVNESVVIEPVGAVLSNLILLRVLWGSSIMPVP